ncbi:SDR family oxidoreductase [Nocardioides sp. CER19]|uniref:SDR family oxidoreductase n=1 Tax=Nocardioides sp. CER19 TaxID=3038538 RepID=UPI00244CE07B|nr:SDR family oxidoreductase [Nocardioides sp. CER19]MDH2413908.1 SDR family oxidoreductase [Nocardioides sp. CER19]
MTPAPSRRPGSPKGGRCPGARQRDRAAAFAAGGSEFPASCVGTESHRSSESFGEQTPMGRAGQPAEAATAFVDLASREARSVTGEVLAVTGGQPVTV